MFKIVTDGQLKKMLEEKNDFYQTKIFDWKPKGIIEKRSQGFYKDLTLEIEEWLKDVEKYV